MPLTDLPVTNVLGTSSSAGGNLVLGVIPGPTPSRPPGWTNYCTFHIIDGKSMLPKVGTPLLRGVTLDPQIKATINGGYAALELQLDHYPSELNWGDMVRVDMPSGAQIGMWKHEDQTIAYDEKSNTWKATLSPLVAELSDPKDYNANWTDVAQQSQPALGVVDPYYWVIDSLTFTQHLQPGTVQVMGATSSYCFTNSSPSDVLNQLLQLGYGWWWFCDGMGLVDVRNNASYVYTVNYGREVILGQEQSDIHALANQVIVTGGQPNGVTVAITAVAEDVDPENAYSIPNIGKRTAPQYNDPGIMDQNTAQRIADNLLLSLERPVTKRTIKLSNYYVTRLPRPGDAILLRIPSPDPTGSTQLPVSYGDIILLDRPVTYYRMDEASGTTIHDISGLVNNATVHNPSDVTLNQLGAVYDEDASIKFGGTDGYLEAAIPEQIAFPITLECWVNPAMLPQLATLASIGDTASGYSIQISDYMGNIGSNLVFQANGLGWLDSGYAFPAANQWYHVAVVNDGVTCLFYVDGKLVGTAPNFTTPNAPDSSSHLWIATMDGSRQYFNGLLDEVAVYDYSLTSSQINNHYNPSLGIVAVQYQIQGVTTYGASGSFELDCVDIPVLYAQDPEVAMNAALNALMQRPRGEAVFASGPSGSRWILDNTSFRVYDGTGNSYGAPSGAGIVFEASASGDLFIKGTLTAPVLKSASTFTQNAQGVAGGGAWQLDAIYGLRFWNDAGDLTLQLRMTGTLAVNDGTYDRVLVGFY